MACWGGDEIGLLVWLVAHHTQPNTQHPHALHYQNKQQMGFPNNIYATDHLLLAYNVKVASSSLQDWLPQHNGRLHFLSVGLALASEHARNGLVVLLVILRPIRTLSLALLCRSFPQMKLR